MKLRMIDRLISAVVGVLLLVMAVILLTETVFTSRLLEIMGRMAAGKTGADMIALIAAAAILALAGALSIHLAVRRVRGKDFVVQSTDAGELSISIRAIEGLVQKCVDKHEELHVSSTLLENTRDGLVISMRINLASGVNIPLAVNALQKQIKQYVTACSGVDVYEVKVQVDTTAAKTKPSIYAVPDVLENPAPLPREEEKVPEAEPAAAPAEAKEKEEKCLHQRLFGEEEQPAIVPAPPEMMEAQQAEAPAEVEAAEEETAAEAPVLEVEEAIEAEEEIPVLEIEEAADEETEAEDLADLEEADEEYAVDEESIADLAALDGAEEEPVQEDEEEAEPVQAADPAADAEAE